MLDKFLPAFAVLKIRFGHWVIAQGIIIHRLYIINRNSPSSDRLISKTNKLQFEKANFLLVEMVNFSLRVNIQNLQCAIVTDLDLKYDHFLIFPQFSS